ncbi:MAG: HIT family protein [Candidatus Levybacteria bacterium]|nr:HIT family protein [Candidatus Levybacteria bacterium]
MAECLFCNIVNKKVPSVSIYEDKETLAFMELFPSSPGHSMVIHKKHGYSILDYTQEELGKIMATTKIIADKTKKALNCDSITIGINHFEKRGLPHLHIHLIPRREDDKGGIIQSVVNNPAKESREVIAEKIRKAKV